MHALVASWAVCQLLGILQCPVIALWCEKLLHSMLSNIQCFFILVCRNGVSLRLVHMTVRTMHRGFLCTCTCLKKNVRKWKCNTTLLAFIWNLSGGMGRAMSNGNILLTYKILIIWRSLINKGSVFFSGIDVELARSIEERIMLEDAQSWVNGRTINEIKDIRSGKLLMLFNWTIS